MRKIRVLGTGVFCALLQVGTLHAQGLVTLYQVSAFDVTVPHPREHRSAVLTSYDDRDIVETRFIAIRYRGCVTTPTGAIRLSVYHMAGSQNVPHLIAHMPQHARQYSRSVIIRKTTGLNVYQFIAAPVSTYYIKVDVLSHRPCTYWGMATTGG